MSKVAYLVGPTGAGKNFVTKQFASSATVISIDEHIRPIAEELCPYLRERQQQEQSLWKALVTHCDAPAGIAKVLQRRDAVPAVNRCVLIEGEMLCYEFFFDGFKTALELCGITADAEEVFWLEPPVDVHLKQIHQRGVLEQREWSSAEVEDWRRRYRAYLNENRRLEGVKPRQSSGALVIAIAEFFGVCPPPDPDA